MAFRLWIGGLPHYCTHDDLASWIFGVTGQWPTTRQLARRSVDSTLQCGFVGFNTQGSMQLALTGLQASPWYANCKTTVAVSRDSKGMGKGAASPTPASASTAAPVLVDTGVEAKPVLKDASASTADPVLVDTGVEAKPAMKDAGAQTTWSMVKPGLSADNGLLQVTPAAEEEEEIKTNAISPTEAAHSPTISLRSRSPSSPPPTVLVDPGVAKEESQLADTSRKIQHVKEELRQLREEAKEEDSKEEKQLAEPVV